MARFADSDSRGRANRWRSAAWAVALLVWLAPLAAMRVTQEVNWGLEDFIVAGILIFGVGVLAEGAIRMTDDGTYRAAVAVALAALFLLVWLSLGVGIIGADGDPANLMYFGVLAVGFLGAVIARFRPAGMARALFATALAQGVVATIAIVSGLGRPWSGPIELLLLNGFFVALFIGSALLFRSAARRDPARRTA